jgi:hypothetical protein
MSESQKRSSAKNTDRPILLEKKSDPSLCWVPGCNKKGEHYDLSFDDDGCRCGCDVILCPLHIEEAVRAGQ